MKHVFLSYVHEDLDILYSIRLFLEELGIEVWMDRTSLAAGQRWKNSIRKAISKGAFFIACFSHNYTRKDSTYMNEELTVTIEELRLKPFEKSWFIPIRLTDCEIPERIIGAGEILPDIQRIDLFPDFVRGLHKLAEVLLPTLRPQTLAKATFEGAIELHIKRKIEHFSKMGALRFRNVRDKWLELLDKSHLDFILESFSELHTRAQSTGQHKLDQFVEPPKDGKLIILSAVPHCKITAYIKSLFPKITEIGHKYLDFIIEKRRQFRLLPNWKNRDFIHIIQFEEDDEVTVDMLYLED